MKTLLLLLLTTTSLGYMPTAFEEFENCKAFSLIAFGCFALFWVKWKNIFKDYVAFWLFVFTVSAGLSTIYSIDPWLSLWGNVKCRAGVLVIASYLIFYLALRQYFTDRLKKKAINLLVFISFIVSGYAIIQACGLDPKQWRGTLKEINYTRPISTFGHPNFMANYLGMTIPFILWAIQGASQWKKIACWVVATMSLAAVWLSLSRGMLIACIAGLLVYFLVSGVHIKKMVMGFLGVATVLMASLFVFPEFKATALQRMESLVSPDTRTEYYKASIRIWQKYPWLGIGTDAYELGFQHERTPYYWQIEPKGSPHKAHNDFLNILATQGIFGTIAAVFLTFSIFAYAMESRSKYLAPAVASITVFYVAGLTCFFIVGTTVLFLFSAALLIEDKND